ncbi:MAG: hypothetical protein KatS3mg033_0560 [Thermonema sp.]|uniref:DEAD/DEAH box helicase n=1 Tax=Thermonema sp. TaxID=2231181 RepID=UPI0021DC1718|nr:DEAD/DEAH box helicase [Thermonema sp.]GIV38760.1 MAG: hypothetical protein KatS3mg033_0560 [Thermonema sp.]
MKVATTQPFRIVYSLFAHEYLGYLLESFAIQLNSKGELTLRYQNISAKNIHEFAKEASEVDYELTRLMDSIQPEQIVRKFYNKKISQADFFLKIYHPEKGDKILQESIARYIEERRAKILALLRDHDRPLYIMGNDGNPAWQQVEIMKEAATVLFHFRRHEHETHYFPTIKHAGQKVHFHKKESILICHQPAWLLIENKLYHFADEVEGQKLSPFLKRPFIAIKRELEETYYRKFVAPLIARYQVFAKGFDIIKEKPAPRPLLWFSSLAAQQKLVPAGEDAAVEQSGQILFQLQFDYGRHRCAPHDEGAALVSVEHDNDHYTFYKTIRSLFKEQAIIQSLKEKGLILKKGRAVWDAGAALAWIDTHREALTAEGFVLEQKVGEGKAYFVGKPSISIAIEEVHDWFDIKAKVFFGEYEIPFLKLREYILSGKREFLLPNGQIAVIPEEWFERYYDLFHYAQPNGQTATLRPHHVQLVEHLHKHRLAEVRLSERLQRLRSFEKIEDYPLPEGFRGELRPYQKAGYNWLRFLNEYQLGGCLADHMGLGKTIQTLALLQAEKEKGASTPSLVVVPTSLVYNWQLEAEKFTPGLKIFVYTGTYRNKDISQFQGYDIVLTSYGIVRLDIDLLKDFPFHYVILDEAQAIKNPSSNISKAVNRLKSKHRLILTGTPIENSTLDLWSQMNFVNPGLLGSQAYFKRHFLYPIERDGDEAKKEKLYYLIKPFVLRRNKAQVAKDLPEKIEQTIYCDMSELQAKVYEEEKSKYRNEILQRLEKDGLGKTQFLLLQGLTRLRQIANHPRLAFPDYEGNSGKLEEVLDKLAMIVQEGAKVLVFSQFVSHLKIVKDYLDLVEWNYAYLDGATKDRQAEVERFQNDENVKVFLISLKAGGLGLNLTAAEYVLLLDPWWNPAVEAQAIDRAHRIGQKNTVITYRFISKNTVEEKILALQRSKRQLAEELITVEEGFMKSLSSEDIMMLLN